MGVLRMPTSLTVTQFHELQQLTAAFAKRDLEVAGVVLYWVLSNGFAINQLIEYCRIFPAITQLLGMGYFDEVHTVPQAQAIREVEKQLPKPVRSYWRKERLKNYAGYGIFSASDGSRQRRK
jgi:glutamate-1-semialdehyde aminotransferase